MEARIISFTSTINPACKALGYDWSGIAKEKGALDFLTFRFCKSSNSALFCCPSPLAHILSIFPSLFSSLPPFFCLFFFFFFFSSLMGQQTSKHHAPLTFGYVNRPDRSHSDSQDPEPHDRDPLDDNDDALNDFVLANPHLYRLEFTCQNNCGTKHKRQSTASSADEHPLGRSSTASRPESVIVATKVDQECKFCRQNKRLSLVRRDLAEDLAYIDETYYPDVIHYVPNDDVLESELLQMDAEDDDQQQPSHSDINWAKLTIGDVTPGRSRPRRLTGASLAVDLSGRALIKLSPSIGYLDNLTKLNL